MNDEAPKLRFQRTTVVRTKSDHLGVREHYLINGEPFTISFWNRGDHGTLDDLERMADPDLTDMLGTCEMFNQQRMLAKFMDKHLDEVGVILSHLPGGRSNPFFYNRLTTELREIIQFRLLPEATRPKVVGKHNMQKNFVGGVFHFNPAPCRVVAGCCHQLQSVWMPGRRGPARDFNTNLVRGLAGYTAIQHVVADWNDEADGRSQQPLRAAHYRQTQRLDPTNTHPASKAPAKGRQIDGGVFLPPR